MSPPEELPQDQRDAIRALVDGWPPLTPGQCDQLVTLLRPGVVAREAARDGAEEPRSA